MILKELAHSRLFLRFIPYLTENNIPINDFVKLDFNCQLGVFIEFIDNCGINILVTNYFVQFAWNANSKRSIFDNTKWIAIASETIKFEGYTNIMLAYKKAIIKAFEIIEPF